MEMTDVFESDIICINCKSPDKKDLYQLRNKIFETSKQDIDWGKQRATRWLLLESKLMKNKRCRVLYFEEVKKLNDTSKDLALESEKELRLFLRFHHTIGTLMYFAEEGIDDIVILDPQWLVDSFKAIITAKQFRDNKDAVDSHKLLHEEGILKEYLMDYLWRKKKSQDRFLEFKDQLTLLMEKLDLISRPMSYNEGTHINPDYYIVPCMLSTVNDEDLSEYKKLDESEKNFLVFEFQNKFLPSATVHRLLATCIERFGEKVKGKNKKTKDVYCDAAVFEVYDGHYLLLEIKHPRIIAYVNTIEGVVRDIGVCQGIREFLGNTLECITGSQRSEVKYELKVPCGKTDYGLLKWKDIQRPEDPICTDHNKKPGHKVKRSDIRNMWQVVSSTSFHFLS